MSHPICHNDPEETRARQGQAGRVTVQKGSQLEHWTWMNVRCGSWQVVKESLRYALDSEK